MYLFLINSYHLMSKESEPVRETYLSVSFSFSKLSVNHIFLLFVNKLEQHRISLQIRFSLGHEIKFVKFLKSLNLYEFTHLNACGFLF